MSLRFSSRLPKDLDPSPFFAELETAKAKVREACAATAAKNGARKDCESFIDMTVSSPLRVGLPFDLDPAVNDARADFGTWVADAAGRRDTREAVAEYYRERGGWFSAEQILLTASTSEAYSILFKTFCNPGDVILTPMPGYPLLDTLAQLEHLECYPYFLKLVREKPLRNSAPLKTCRRHLENGDGTTAESLAGNPSSRSGNFRFVIDTDSLLSAPDNAKILLLVSPHNPTGHCVSEKEWVEIVRFCEERNLILVIDEVFGDYAIDPSIKRSWQFLRRKASAVGAADGNSSDCFTLRLAMTEEERGAKDEIGQHLELRSLVRMTPLGGRESAEIVGTCHCEEQTSARMDCVCHCEERSDEAIKAVSLDDSNCSGYNPIDAPTDGPKCPIFWLNGLSKTVGSPQLKLGWMAFYAPEKDFEPIRAALEFVADAYLSVSAPAQALGRHLLKDSSSYELTIRQRIQQNWNMLQSTFPSKYCPKVLGGWYAAIHLGDDDEELTLGLLLERHVLVQPGFFFDFEEDGWIVVSLLQEPDKFADAVRRIAAFR